MVLLDKKRARDLKLIDYGELSNRGDYIIDYGALLSDLRVFGPIKSARENQWNCKETSLNHFTYMIPQSRKNNYAIRFFKNQIKRITRLEKDNDNLGCLHLSEARYLIRNVSRITNEFRAHQKAFIVYCEALKSLKNAAEYFS